MSAREQVVCIVDDDEAVRNSIRLLLQSVGVKTSMFASATEFLKVIDGIESGCVLLDVRMPSMSGLELFDQLLAQRVHLPVIFITGHGDVPMAVRAVKKGAFDFLQKPFNDQELIDRVNDALREDSRRLSEQSDRQALRRHFESLTPREREIMERIVAGQANKVIAIELQLSERTVELHRARVMEKMQVRCLAELVATAVKLKS
ncbi:MAG: response regulator [Gammaproteobacteria bacterium]